MRGRRTRIWIAAVLASPLIAVAGYLLAALGLGLIPLNGVVRSAPEAVDIYLQSNGIHADLILPIQSRDVDWDRQLPMATLRPVAQATDVLAFGWGDRGVYIETPTWADLRVSTALAAAMGLDTAVMHVAAVTRPPLGASTRLIRLSPERYRRLAAFIGASFARGADGTVIPIDGAHYGRHDAFFEAKGRYSVFRTCNEWTREALSAAGVRVPLWSPFASALLFHLPQGDAQRD